MIPKTASYTINPAIPDSPGTLFTNRGATGAIVFTLPAPSPQLIGWFYDFLVIADFSVTVRTATVDTMVILNDVAGKSIGAAGAATMIGAYIRAICDGTQWVGVGLTVGTVYTQTA